MKSTAIGLIAVLSTLGVACADRAPDAPADSSPHDVEFVTVAEGVQLEVLDWGGSGRPLVLLTGQGDDAHVFDGFARRFVPGHRVVGITRRGYGRSDKPAPTTENYAVDLLADDVLAVIAALKLDRPVVAGHSIAGQELSSIGARHPDRVAGLIYLDAHGPSAFYDQVQGNYGVEMAELLRRLHELSAPDPALDRIRLRELQESRLLQRFDKQVGEIRRILDAQPAASDGLASRPDPKAAYGAAINRGQRIFTAIRGPILAIAASPHDYDKDRPPETYAYETRQTAAFEQALPNARVVRIPYASHYVFRSHEDEVVREMNAFMDAL